MGAMGQSGGVVHDFQSALERSHLLCDVDGCEETSSCGTPTPQGYRWTCGFHVPIKEPR
jgi:hypothetical protein